MKKYYIIKYLRIIISIILFILILYFLNWNDMIKAVSKVNPKILILAFSLHFIGLFISVIRWKLLLEAAHVKEAFKNLLIIYWVSLFYNLFLPTSIGGDLVRIYDLNKATGKLEGSIASVVMDRLTGMIVLLCIALIAILFNFKLYNPNLLTWTIIFLIIFLLFFLMLFSLKIKKIFNYIIPNFLMKLIQQKLEKFFNAFHLYKTNYKAIFVAIIWGILLQLNVIFYFYLIGKSLQIDLDFIHYCVAVPIIQVITLIPISLSGIGVREAATITILAIYNTSSESAFSLSILGFTLALIFNSIGGIFQTKLQEVKNIEKEIKKEK